MVLSWLHAIAFALGVVVGIGIDNAGLGEKALDAIKAIFNVIPKPVPLKEPQADTLSQDSLSQVYDSLECDLAAVIKSQIKTCDLLLCYAKANRPKRKKVMATVLGSIRHDCTCVDTQHQHVFDKHCCSLSPGSVFVDNVMGVKSPMASVDGNL